MRKFTIILTFIITFILLTVPVSAQDNLLHNAGFDAEQYGLVSTGSDNTMFHVPIAWGGAVITQPHTESWENITPNGFPHTFNFVRSGPRSYNISRGFATFTAYIYQHVPVVPQTEVRGGAFAFMQSHHTAVARVGIDPTGGADPNSPNIVWAESNSRNQWVHLEVSTQAQADVVTLFLFGTQSRPNNPNDIYWDDAYLFGTPGNATPGVAAPPPQKIAEPLYRMNVRSGAGTGFDRIGGVEPGQTYAVLAEYDSGWVQIAYNGGVGYVSRRYVEIRDGAPTADASVAPAAPAAAPSAPAAASLDFHVDYQLNLRAEPNTDSAILLQIPWQATVTAIGRTSDNVWLQVQYNGQTGWLAARYGRFESGSIGDLGVAQ
jgi:uncharacterized protein YraI